MSSVHIGQRVRSAFHGRCTVVEVLPDHKAVIKNGYGIKQTVHIAELTAL